jgi:hypothetical protein
MMFNCLGSPLYAVRHRTFGSDDRMKLASVPAMLKSELIDGEHSPIVEMQPEETVARSFAYVYSEVERTRQGMRAISRYVPIDFLEDPKSMTAVGMNGVVHSHSCSSVLSQSTSVEGGYSIPVASFKLALSSEYSSSTNWGIALVRGRFLSPLVSMLEGTNAERLYSRLLLWDWYKRNPEEIGKTNYLLCDFDGFSLYTIGGNKRSTKSTISGSAGATLPWLVASTKGHASYESNSETKIENYKSGVMVLPSGPQKEFIPLKTPAQLIAEVAVFRTDLDKETYSQALFPQTTHTHRQLIAGIPENFCNPLCWTAESENVQPVFLQDVKQVGSGESQKCEFTVVYTPPGTEATSVTLNYGFVWALDGTNRLKLKASPVPLAPNTSPTLIDAGYNPRFKVSKADDANGPYTKLSWKLLFNVSDIENLLKPGMLPDVSGLKLQCANNMLPLSTNPRMLGSNPKQLELAVVYSYYSAEPLETEDLSKSKQCSLVGDMKFTLSGDRTVSRAVPVNNLTFPSVKVTKVEPKAASGAEPEAGNASTGSRDNH